MKLIHCEPRHLSQVSQWFSSQQELTQWAGPNFRYPFDQKSFYQDTKLEQLASYVLVDDAENVMAFGQFYERNQKVHLGRLAVHPDCRGQGIVRQLVEQLAIIGQQTLKRSSLSLFVLESNKTALKAYLKLGFKQQHYPDALPLENCLYFVKEES